MEMEVKSRRLRSALPAPQSLRCFFIANANANAAVEVAEAAVVADIFIYIV